MSLNFQSWVIWASLFFVSPTYAACIGLACTCTASASPVAFGNYNPLAGTTINQNGNVAVTCSALLIGLNVSYVISLSEGSGGSGFSPRKMRYLTTNLLSYNLYTTTARNIIWGNGSAGTSTISDAYLLNLISVTRNYPVYGTLFANQNVVPGAYSDTITATVTY